MQPESDVLALDPPGPEEIRALSWIGWGGGGLHWSRNTITYSFIGPDDRTPPQFAPSARQTPLDPTQIAAFETALSRWEAVANIDFVPYQGDDPGRADLRIGYADFPASSGLSAVTWVTADGKDRIRSSEIWLNNRDAHTGDLEPGTFGGLAAMHEIGHALGLGHPFEGAATLPPEKDHRGVTIMSYTDHPGTGRDAGNAGLEAEPRTPMLYDIAVVQRLYGANTSYATGDDVYRFPDGMARIETIWDAGGRDTIDASDQSLPAVIDLREGGYSSIGRESSYGPGRERTAKDNLAIAFGTNIENAIGGKGDDLLIGNALDNTLEGGGGSDILTGGAGQDLLLGGAGADVFRDTPAGLDGDTLADFDGADRIDILGTRLADSQLTTRTEAGLSRLAVDLDGDGRPDVSIGFAAPLTGAFRVVEAGDTHSVLELQAVPAGPGDEVAETPSADGGQGITWSGTEGADRRHGSDFADTLSGMGGADRLFGEGGDDRLFGGDGKDKLVGGDGADLLDGGAGKDRLLGGTGDDRLFGGTGRDKLLGGDGADLLDGGDDADKLLGGTGDDRLFGGAGTDKLVGGDGADMLDGGPGDDRLVGGAGTDTFLFSGDFGSDQLVDAEDGEVLRFPGLSPQDLDFARSGANLIIAHGGDQVVVKGYYRTAPSLLIDDQPIAGLLEPSSSPATPRAPAGLTWTGDAGDDRKAGTGADDLLDGGPGNDRLYGRGGDDTLIGGPGNDRLYGKRGDDLLLPGSGDDRVVGGRGTDTVRVEGRYADFALHREGKNWILEDLRPDDGDAGTDRIRASEILQFDDVRLDISGAEPKLLDGGDIGGAAPAPAGISSLVPDGEHATLV